MNNRQIIHSRKTNYQPYSNFVTSPVTSGKARHIFTFNLSRNNFIFLITIESRKIKPQITIQGLAWDVSLTYCCNFTEKKGMVDHKCKWFAFRETKTKTTRNAIVIIANMFLIYYQSSDMKHVNWVWRSDKTRSPFLLWVI